MARPRRAVLLDLYDTLAWTEWPTLRRQIEERTGLSSRALLDGFDRTRDARSVGTYGSVEGDLRVVLEAAGLEPDADLVEELAGLADQVLTNGVHLWEDSIPVLRELRARGTRTAIVSNCDHSTRPVVERLGLPREADAMVLSFEAGVAKPDPGIYLAALQAVDARPQEALFVDDQARYCDGAVALGMEALSRGAAHVTFLDNDAAAVKAIGENLRKLGETGAAKVVRADATRPPPSREPCDLVFLDPPYRSGQAPAAMTALAEAGWMSPGCIVTVELAHNEDLLPPQGFESIDERRYGAAKIVFLKRTA